MGDRLMYHFSLSLCRDPLNWLTHWTDGVESYKSEEICGWLQSVISPHITRDKLFEEKASSLISIFYFSEINIFVPNSVGLPLPLPPPLILQSWLLLLRVWKADSTCFFSSRTCSASHCSAVSKSHLQYKDIDANAVRALHSYDMCILFSVVRVIRVSSVQRQSAYIICSERLPGSVGSHMRSLSKILLYYSVRHLCSRVATAKGHLNLSSRLAFL